MKTTATATERSAQPAPTADSRTRDRVAGLLLELGPSTASRLGAALGLSPAAIRRHLDAMLVAGTVVAREPRPLSGRGRGRPAKVFALSERGREAFPHAYDDLAASALRFLRETGGEDAISAFAVARLAAHERRYRSAVEDASVPARAGALAEALSADGYAARTSDRDSGTQLCQHHCPVQHVAAEFPQLCEAETAFFSALLGTHVQRLATIAHGDGVCTTYIPHRTISPGSTSSASTSPASTSPASTSPASTSPRSISPRSGRTSA